MHLEIWLDNALFCFGRAVLHANDGTVKELTGSVETSLSGAKRLVLSDPNPIENVCLFSWYFKYGILEPETWVSSIDKIIFHNNSSQDIYIWRYAYLSLNETANVSYLNTQHHEQLGVYRPLGMGVFQLTTQKDDDFRVMLGEHGLILYKRTRSEADTVFVRFIRDRFLRVNGVDSSVQNDNYGFETSVGELSRFSDSQVLLTTAHSKYHFEMDTSRI